MAITGRQQQPPSASTRQRSRRSAAAKTIHITSSGASVRTTGRLRVSSSVSHRSYSLIPRQKRRCRQSSLAGVMSQPPAPSRRGAGHARRPIASVEEVAALTQPSYNIHWSTARGRRRSAARRCRRAVPASHDARLTDSYLALSDPDDVARVEDQHHLLQQDPMSARATTGAAGRCGDSAEELFDGSMLGRTLYVAAVLDGPARLADLPYIGALVRSSATIACSTRDHDVHRQRRSTCWRKASFDRVILWLPAPVRRENVPGP